MMFRPLALLLSLTILTTLAAVFPRTSGADPIFYQGFIEDVTPREIPPGVGTNVRLRVRNTGVSAFYIGEIVGLPGGWISEPIRSEPTFINDGRAGNIVFRITPPAGAAPVPQPVTFRLTTLVNDSPFLEKFLDQQTFQIRPVPVPGAFTLISPSEMQTGVAQPFFFRWNPSNTAETYTLRLWAEVNGEPVEPPAVFEGITGTTFTPPDDFRVFEGGGEVYFWGVTAFNSQGQTENTEGPIPFQMFIETPVGPFNIVQPAVDDQVMTTQPRFEWTTSAGATLYWVKVHRLVDGLPDEPPLFDYLLDAPVNSFQMPDVLPAGRYGFVVSAFNRSGGRLAEEAFRTFIATSIGGFALIEPSPGATNLSETPRFRWQMAQNVLGYRVELAFFLQSGWEVLQSPPLSPFDTTYDWREPRLLPGVEYYWRVVAVTNESERPNDGNWQPFTVSPLHVFRTVAPYQDETGVPFVPVFEWQESRGATAYQVQLAPDLAGAPNLNAVQTSPVLGSDVRSWTSGFAPLFPNTRHYFRVRATAGGAERFSEEGWVPFRTSVMTPFSLVAPANGASAVARAPFLQWQPVTGATGYRVHVSLVGAGSLPVQTVSTNTPSLAWPSSTPLAPGAQFEWTVEAIHPDESRLAEQPFRFTTVIRAGTATRDDVIDALLGRAVLSPADRLQLGIPAGRAISVQDVIPYTN